METSIRPEPSAWEGLLRGRSAPDAAALRFRRQLDLPTDRPVILTGHQAQFWHPGILSKLIAACAAGSKLNAAVSWLVVDQDDHDPWAVAYPVRRADGRLERRTWRIGAGAEHLPTANLPAEDPSPVPTLGAGESFGAPEVGPGLRRIAEATARHAGASSASRQVVAATMDLLADLARPRHTAFATSMRGTDLFGEIVARMKRAPAEAARCYNDAARARAGARIAPLNEGGADTELPLWHIPTGKGSARRRVFASMLDNLPASELAPRALLMTGLLRWAGCDLFVHGTGGAGEKGGGGYDAITEEWFRAWLGVELAPAAMVTATLRLNIQQSGTLITPDQIARARWLAHAARHRPSLLRDAEGESARGAALATLQRLRGKRDTQSRRVKLETYRSLHRTLEGFRTRHAADLERLTAEAAAAAARREEAEIIADRTWAFPLYEFAQLQNLKAAIDGQFRAAWT